MIVVSKFIQISGLNEPGRAAEELPSPLLLPLPLPPPLPPPRPLAPVPEDLLNSKDVLKSEGGKEGWPEEDELGFQFSLLLSSSSVVHSMQPLPSG
jgi:hypothetical protein